MSTMPKYIVSTIIQAPLNEPVDVNWYKGDDLAQALAAVVSAAVHDRDVDDSNMPPMARYRTLGVTLSIEQEVAQPEVWCNSHEGRHAFTDGGDGDTPCIGWRTEEEMVRATPSTDEMPTGLGICGAHNGLHLYDVSRCQMWVPATTPSTEDPAVLEAEFDCEAGDYALDDCVYWGTSSDECAGPRVGVRTSTGAVVCEKHFNHPPKN